MAKRQYTWFLEPLDNRTNEVIGKALGEMSEENFHQSIVFDGKRHNLWECPAQLVADFNRSRTNLGLRFLVYNRLGNGKIRLCPLFLCQQRRRKKPSKKQAVPH